MSFEINSPLSLDLRSILLIAAAFTRLKVGARVFAFNFNFEFVGLSTTIFPSSRQEQRVQICSEDYCLEISHSLPTTKSYLEIILSFNCVAKV